MIDILYMVAYALIGVLVLLWLVGVRIIPNSKVGIIEKRISLKGSLDNQIIALDGEAG